MIYQLKSYKISFHFVHQPILKTQIVDFSAFVSYPIFGLKLKLFYMIFEQYSINSFR